MYGQGQGYSNQDFQNLSQSMMTQSQLPFKNIITTEDIKEIVKRLNSDPFNEQYSLVTFDELTALEMLELINKIFIHLDPKWAIDIRNDGQENIVYKISESLKILNYPSQFDTQWQNSLLQADKRTVYPIFYYLLTRLQDCEKRAYLAKFLMPVAIPEEFLVDTEIKTQIDQYKDLQAEFQVHHQSLESLQGQSMNPTEFKKDIAQLEQEKEQLVSKITIFKNKNTNKPQFQALLEATNLLRKEQEEEARIQDKLRQQRQQLEWTDQQLLAQQQRLLDAKKSLSPDNTPEQMLQAMRNEVKKNREICKDRLGLELNEKRKKLEMLERILSEPPITVSELNQMENHLMTLRRNVNAMEDKLRREAKPEDDKLAIYKQQAQLITKKKERMIEDLKKTEEEFTQVEKDVQKKEEAIQKERGPGYKSKDEFKVYAAELKEKTAHFKKLKDELKLLESEKGVLERTLEILRKQKVELDQQIKQLEEQHGVLGLTEMKDGLEKVSEQKGAIDEKKGKTLEEISKIVVEIENKCNQKKPVLQGQLAQIKELRKTYAELEVVYNSKKSEYDRVMVGTENESASIIQELKKLKEEVYGTDNKIQTLKYRTEVIDVKVQRLNDEAEYLKGTKTLSKEFKSNSDMLQARATKLEAQIKELRQAREMIKENHEPSLKQMTMFNDLKKLLNIKLKVAKNEVEQRQNERGGYGAGNMNRLVIGD